MQTAQLIPVSEWVYDLYKVSYWAGNPEAGGHVVKTLHIAASSDNHLESEAHENFPVDGDYFIWERVKENIGHPRVVGHMYGMPVYERGRSHGEREAQQM